MHTYKSIYVRMYCIRVYTPIFINMYELVQYFEFSQFSKRALTNSDKQIIIGFFFSFNNFASIEKPEHGPPYNSCRHIVTYK